MQNNLCLKYYAYFNYSKLYIRFKQHMYKNTPRLELPYYNLTNYPLAVKGQLEKIPYDEKESELLKYHQFLVKEFFTRNPHQRGLLICHGMGQGKTRLAVAISTFYRTFDDRRKIIILSAKSLEANFKKEVASYTGKDAEYIDNNYKFISLNASNMFRQISNADKSSEEIELEKKLGSFMEDIAKDSSLENCLLIIDEAHNLFNSITNGAKNAVSLYDLIMETRNIKLIFMSGTPIINDPFELVPCFNMLRGPIIVDGGNNSVTFENNSVSGGDADAVENDAVENDAIENDAIENDIDSNKRVSSTDDINETRKSSDGLSNKKKTFDKKTFGKKRNNHDSKHNDKHGNKHKKEKTVHLFSEDIEEFESYFVDKEKKVIKNKDKFTNRIFGLTSYYGDIYFPSSKNKQGFPKELENIIEKVPMSQTQYARYSNARLQELEETKNGYRNKASRFSSSSGGNSTYRVKSRQISNYCIPEYALGPVRGAKSREKFIHKIKIEDLQNLDEFSPKMGAILTNIEKHNGQPGMIYSQFVSGEGIAIFARVLKAHGYKLFGDETGDEYDIKQKNKGIFAILSGDITPDQRLEIINTYNSKENRHGDLIKILLLSGAVAEGIDLKRIRHVHIMEPFWNYARISQVKTRAIRYLSHEDLPENERNVQVYIYLSDYPVGYPKNKKIEDTTDIDLFKHSINNMEIINTFMQALAEASIDCALHYSRLDADVRDRLHCKLCSPDNHALYHPLLKKDMDLPSTCRPYSEQKIQVQEIVIPNHDEKFFYRKTIDNDANGNEQFKIYHFNKKINGYAPLLRTHPLYGDIMETLILKENSGMKLFD